MFKMIHTRRVSNYLVVFIPQAKSVLWPSRPVFFYEVPGGFPQGPVNSPAGTAGSNRAVRCGCSGRLQVHPEGGCTWHTTHPRRRRNADERSFRAPRIGESCCNAKGLDARSCKIMSQLSILALTSFEFKYQEDSIVSVEYA